RERGAGPPRTLLLRNQPLQPAQAPPGLEVAVGGSPRIVGLGRFLHLQPQPRSCRRSGWGLRRYPPMLNNLLILIVVIVIHVIIVLRVVLIVLRFGLVPLYLLVVATFLPAVGAIHTIHRFMGADAVIAHQI